MKKIYGWLIVAISITTSFFISLQTFHNADSVSFGIAMTSILVVLLAFFVLFFVGVYLIHTSKKTSTSNNISPSEVSLRASDKILAFLFFLVTSLYSSIAFLLTLSYVYDHGSYLITILFVTISLVGSYFASASIFSLIVIFIKIKKASYTKGLKYLLIIPTIFIVFYAVALLFEM